MPKGPEGENCPVDVNAAAVMQIPLLGLAPIALLLRRIEILGDLARGDFCHQRPASPSLVAKSSPAPQLRHRDHQAGGGCEMSFEAV